MSSKERVKPLLTPIELLGRTVLSLLYWSGKSLLFLLESLIGLLKPEFFLQDLIYQLVHLGFNSISIVVMTVTFSGMVISLELAKEAVQYGVSHMVGGGVAIAMAREFGPMLTAIVLSGRVGSAITAEIATMKVTEQLDALETLGLNPIRFLMAPRLIANLIAFPLITLVSEISGTYGGYLVAHLYAGITARVYTDSIHRFLSAWDVWGGLIKSLVFAIIVTVISGLMGFEASRDAYGVGRATTASVVWAIIVIFIANFFLSYLLFT